MMFDEIAFELIQDGLRPQGLEEAFDGRSQQHIAERDGEEHIGVEQNA